MDQAVKKNADEITDSRCQEEESVHLAGIIRKIRRKIESVNRSISEGQQEIAGMHDYYWQNYTEMDEYGYENYDNRQALLSQVNANQEQATLRRRLKRMLDSPYFGRVDFRYAGEETAESFYIGIGNFAEQTGETPLIYDWRAPVSSLFYDYDRGAASYESPSGMIGGEIVSKWQYKIRDGKLVYAFESDMKIDDEILKAELSANGDTKLKNIVRTIQREQNAIIRNKSDRILVIQGAAGSGKTSIALHRIAWLLYHDREHLNSSNILILSPNSVFSDYISRILPELGEENIREMSFDLFAYRELKDIADDCEDRFDYLERQIRFPDKEERARFREKQSASFVGLMEGFLATLEDELVDLRDISFQGVKKTEEDLIRLFYFRFQNTPLLRRLDAVREYFADECGTLKGRDLTEEEQEYLRERFDRMYETKDIYEIYNRMLETYGYETLPDVECAKRKIPFEDVYPLLYLKYRLNGYADHRGIKHLVIDEMQDYTYLQYTILDRIFSCRMTILGDRAQTLGGERNDVSAFLPDIFGKRMRRIVIDKSYRNTVEIARYAADLAGLKPPELFERHGKAVEEKTFPDADGLLDAVVSNLDVSGAGENGRYETAALLTMTEGEALELYRRIRGLLPQDFPVHFVGRNSSAFRRGLTVTPCYLAKGLEFDQVFLSFDGKKDAGALQAGYVGATRALHELYVYSEKNREGRKPGASPHAGVWQA